MTAVNIHHFTIYFISLLISIGVGFIAWRRRGVKGYPEGLKGEEIPISARIFTPGGPLDALLSDRPYRAAWDQARVVDYIRQHSGSIFDPSLVEVFLEVVGV